MYNSASGPIMKKMIRIFTRNEAEAFLPDVMRLTGRHREEMEHLWGKLNSASTQIAVLDTYRLLNELKAKWFASVRETGAIPLRLWEVSFDSGDGFHYSWRIGEEKIETFYRQNPDRTHARGSRILSDGSRFPQRKSIGFLIPNG